MDIKSVVESLDKEIAKLQQAKSALLALDGSSTPTTGKKRGRPVGGGVKQVVDPVKPKKRTLSAAGRKRISDAMKKRWSTRNAIKSAPPASKVKKSAPATTKKQIPAQKKSTTPKTETEKSS